MLQELRLKDFVLIAEAHLVFSPGLTVLTGETGAGKSLLMQALGLLLGARGGGHLLRPGACAAVVEAVLAGGEELAQRLEEMGLDPAEEVVLRRVITPAKGRVYINGSPATLQMLSRLTQGLIVLAGQHEYQVLSRPEDRLLLLDQYVGLEEERKLYAQAYFAYREALSAYEDLSQRIGQLERERDLLLFQINEIEEVAPEPGEDEALSEKRRVLRNLARLQETLGQAVSALGQGVEVVSQAKRNLNEAAALDTRLREADQRLEGLFYELEDLALSLEGHLADLQPEEGLLEEIEARLAQLERLKRKYGGTIAAVLEQLAELKDRYLRLEHGEEELGALARELSQREEEALARAHNLSLKRKQGARLLAEAIRKRLAYLGMAEARFVIEVVSAPAEARNLGPHGLDRVEFLVATNPKAPLRPLTQVASGGELSRLFLSLKTALSQDQGAQVLLFDEVDTGIGGVTATKVGDLLKELSQRQQVICVTHLPQIAAKADHHFLVEKETRKGEAYTIIRKLTQEERVSELSRMLGQEEAHELAARMLSAS